MASSVVAVCVLTVKEFALLSPCKIHFCLSIFSWLRGRLCPFSSHPKLATMIDRCVANRLSGNNKLYFELTGFTVTSVGVEWPCLSPLPMLSTKGWSSPRENLSVLDLATRVGTILFVSSHILSTLPQVLSFHRKPCSMASMQEVSLIPLICEVPLIHMTSWDNTVRRALKWL